MVSIFLCQQIFFYQIFGTAPKFLTVKKWDLNKEASDHLMNFICFKFCISFIEQKFIVGKNVIIFWTNCVNINILCKCLDSNWNTWKTFCNILIISRFRKVMHINCPCKAIISHNIKWWMWTKQRRTYCFLHHKIQLWLHSNR